MDLSRNYYNRNSSWNAPYTFFGKEKDEETDDEHYLYITNKGNLMDFYNYLGDLSEKFKTLKVIAARARHDKIYNDMLKKLQNEKK